MLGMRNDTTGDQRLEGLEIGSEWIHLENIYLPIYIYFSCGWCALNSRWLMVG